MCCIVYLDDILIFSNNLKQHRQDVRNILEGIRISGMKVKPSKCEFHKEETEYLGFIINREGIKTDPVKTQAIWDWKTAKNKTDIQSFLGFCNFYRRFIEGYSKTAKTTIQQNAEKIRRQMGMNRQRTIRIRQAKEKTHNGTCYGPLQTRGTDQD